MVFHRPFSSVTYGKLVPSLRSSPKVFAAMRLRASRYCPSCIGFLSLRSRFGACRSRYLTEPLDCSLCHEIDFKKGQEPLLITGMRVVSFCHYLQGPAAMQYLADMGAEVIKIEPPKGAFERHWAGADGAAVGGVSALY